MWMSDVMRGPSVTLADSRTRRKTYLIAFLDDATRVVPYCAFAMSENTQAFLPVFKQALLRDFRSACTWTMAPTTAPSNSRWCARAWAWP